jgi:hypothetical protein
LLKRGAFNSWFFYLFLQSLWVMGEKKNWENRIVKKNWLKFWKNRPVRFWFYKLKTELNRTQTKKKPEKKWAKLKKNRAKLEKTSQTGKKLSKTEPNWKNRAKQEKTEPNRKTKPNWFEPVFYLKNRTEPKPVGLTGFGSVSFFFFNLIIFFL